jgi:hypothetical protein
LRKNRNEEATRVVRRSQHTFSWGPDQGIHAPDNSRVYANRAHPCLCAIVRRYFESYPDDRPEKDARLRHHPSILRDPDETPEDPDAPDNGDRSPAEGVVNELESRLFKGRKVMVFAGLSLAARSPSPPRRCAHRLCPKISENPARRDNRAPGRHWPPWT